MRPADVVVSARGSANGLQSGVFCLDSLRDAQQLGRGACEAVQASDDNDVIGAQLGAQALERGPLLAGAGGFLLEQLFAAGRVEAVALDGEILVGRGHARVPELHASRSIALQILLQKTYIAQIYYANDKSLFLHPAISLRNSLEICECRRASWATPSGLTVRAVNAGVMAP